MRPKTELFGQSIHCVPKPGSHQLLGEFLVGECELLCKLNKIIDLRHREIFIKIWVILYSWSKEKKQMTKSRANQAKGIPIINCYVTQWFRPPFFYPYIYDGWHPTWDLFLGSTYGPAKDAYRWQAISGASAPLSPFPLSPESILECHKSGIVMNIRCRLFFFKVKPEAYGNSQARGRIRATAAGLHHSHSNSGSRPCLQPTSQLTATRDPWPTDQGWGSNLHPHGY